LGSRIIDMGRLIAEARRQRVCNFSLNASRAVRRGLSQSCNAISTFRALHGLQKQCSEVRKAQEN
jgi:hypothetical protein